MLILYRTFESETTVFYFAMCPVRRVFLAIAVLLLMRSVTSRIVSKEVELLKNKRIVNGKDADPGSHPYIISLQVNFRQLYLNDIDLFRKIQTERCAKNGKLAVCPKLNGTNDDLRDWIRNKYPDTFGHVCGGSLIGDVWALTAAHCVDTFKEKHFPHLKIVLGEHHLSENSTTEKDRGVQAIIIHPGWKSPKNDIALIKLSCPVTPSQHIKFATLPEDDSEFFNTECVFAGWGLGNASSNALVLVLQEIYMDAISFNDCWMKLKMFEVYEFIQNSQSDFLKTFGIKLAWQKFQNVDRWTRHLDPKGSICAVDKTPDTDAGHGDTCKGDSGGPMMCGEDHSILAGVTSWGIPGCRGDLPGMYTRVSAYTCWIKQHTGIGM